MPDWRPIDTLKEDIWDPPVVLLRDDAGNEGVGSYGWDDESYDPETGDEWIHGAWHKANEVTQPLGFTPTEWAPLEEGA